MKNGPWILGISASHNGSVCLLNNDKIVVAIQEERLVRKKRFRTFASNPGYAVDYCLNYANINPGDLDLIVVSLQGSIRDPNQDIALSNILRPRFYNIPFRYISHHLGHAMSAYALSGFSESAILIVDGLGSPYEEFSKEEKESSDIKKEEYWETTSLWYASGRNIKPLEKFLVPRRRWITFRNPMIPKYQSLGGLYSAAAHHIFRNCMEAGKVMGLSSYGKPTVPVSKILSFNSNGIKYLNRIPEGLGGKDLATSVQVALEEALMFLISRLKKKCKSKNLCFAGGVALNCIANERIIRESGYENIFIMPAAEDSGVAIGAAFWGLFNYFGIGKTHKLNIDAFGREYFFDEINMSLKKSKNFNKNIKYRFEKDFLSKTVDMLTAGKVIRWFYGRSELGPRALGQRSILCDPRRREMKDILNKHVKFREPFRPYAASVLFEEAGSWFEFGKTTRESPFMLRVLKVKEDKKSLIPAVVHVDGTTRVQTVTKDNGLYYQLLDKFFKKTDVPILLNTSFNFAREPIVETPYDAISCMCSRPCSGNDVLVMVPTPETKGAWIVELKR